MSVRRRVTWVLLVVIATGVTLVFRRLGGPRLLRFPYATGQAASSSPELGAFSIERFEVAEGVWLRSARRPPASATAGWVVFFPGNDDHALDQGARLLARQSGGRGLAVFAPRGFDGSSGSPSPGTAATDALRFVESLNVSPGRVTLVAFSLGGPTAVRVAAELTRRGTPPARLVLVAAATRLAMLNPGPWAPLLQGDVYDADDAGPVGCPVLVVHGSADGTLPPSMATEWGQRFGSQATVSILEGLDHSSILSAVEVP